MQPSEDERVLAALSHASIVANVANLAGMIGTALIWTMQRDRSPYVRAHALQALVYQGAVLLISIFLALLGGLCLALSLLPVMLRPDLYRGSLPSYSVWIGALALLTLLGFGALAMVYGLYGAYQAYRGRPFRYLFVSRLARPHLVPMSAPVSATQSLATQPEATPDVSEPPVASATPAPSQEPAAEGVVPPVMPKRRGRRSAGDGES